VAPHSAGDLVCGRYEIRTLVGKRPLSTVYHAFDREIGVEVALRVIHPELLPDEATRTAFVQKVARVREVAHPNLLRMYDVSTARDEVVVAVQWAPGTTVRELIERAKPSLPAEEVRQIVAAVAAGLGHAHQRGLVAVEEEFQPRDIPGSNLAHYGFVVQCHFVVHPEILRVWEKVTRKGKTRQAVSHLWLRGTFKSPGA
jgi:serine/threonine protein kinase